MENGWSIFGGGARLLEIAVTNLTSQLLFDLLFTWRLKKASLAIFHLYILLAYFILLQVFLFYSINSLFMTNSVLNENKK